MKIKRTLMITGGIAAVAAVGTIGFVYGYKPKPGIPCQRSIPRASRRCSENCLQFSSKSQLAVYSSACLL